LIICLEILSQNIIEKTGQDKGIIISTEEIGFEANRQWREKLCGYKLLTTIL